MTIGPERGTLEERQADMGQTSSAWLAQNHGHPPHGTRIMSSFAGHHGVHCELAPCPPSAVGGRGVIAFLPL